MIGDENTHELLAKARAIHLAMRNGVIGYKEAKNRVQPILEDVNANIEQIATKYKVKPKYIKFQDLGRNL